MAGEARSQAAAIRRAVKAIEATGQRVGAVEISPDGGVRVLAADAVQADDEAARLGRLIEERMSNA